MGFEDDKDEEDEELRLSFGGREGQREWVYARYSMGDQLEVIAADCGKTVNQILVLMREVPALYEQTKKAREAFSGLTLKRSQSIIDAYNLRKLEALNSGKLDLEESADSIKELGKLVKDIANRVRLHEGKATAIVRVDDEELTMEGLKEKIRKIEAAGDGLATN